MSLQSKIERTIKLLVADHSSTSMAVLVYALQVDLPEIRDTAARAILKTESSTAIRELINHVKFLSPLILKEISTHSRAISFPLEQCLKHGDVQEKQNALDLIELAHLYQEIPLILEFLKDANEQLADRAETVLVTIVDRLFDTSQKIKHTSTSNSANYRETMLQALSQELSSFEKLKRPRAVVESLLILSDAQDPTDRQLIRHSSEECQAMVWDILSHSRHPGVLRYLTTSIALKYTNFHVVEILTHRTDIEFQMALIRSITLHTTVNQERNFKQITSFPWLTPGRELWDSIPEELHKNLVRLIQSISLSKPDLYGMAWSIFHEGSLTARLAAADMKSLLNTTEYEACVLRALESEDPELEAWGVLQLRHSNVPNRMQLILDRLDSEHEIIVEYAREALGTMTIQQIIELCVSSKKAMAPLLSQFLIKLNPDLVDDFAKELAHPIRTHRVRAARAAHFLGLQELVLPGLLELLTDQDSIVRRVTFEILGDIPTRQVYSILKANQLDSSPRVREVVENSMEKVARVLKSIPGQEQALEEHESEVSG